MVVKFDQGGRERQEGRQAGMDGRGRASGRAGGR
eukprot:SAG11_NODE_246_length_11683_cov_15.540142_1_plen_33_part_10